MDVCMGWYVFGMFAAIAGAVIVSKVLSRRWP
jgi:hypothetical protein